MAMPTHLQPIHAAILAYDYAQARTLLKTALTQPSAEAYCLAAYAAVDNAQQKRFLDKAFALDPFHPGVAQALTELPPMATEPIAPALMPVVAALDAFDFEQARTLLHPVLQDTPSAQAYTLAALLALTETQRQLFLEKAKALGPQPAPIPSQPAPPPRKLGISLWRMVNAAFILLVFFAPWMNSCMNSNIVKDPQPSNGFLTLWMLLMMSSPALFALALGLLPLFATALGLLAFLVYSPFSLFLALGPRRWVVKPFWRMLAWGLLISCAWSLFYGFLMKMAAPKAIELYVGYWLAWVGLTSGISVEILTDYRQFKSKRATRALEKPQ